MWGRIANLASSLNTENDEEVQLEASSTGAMSSDVSQLEVNDAEIQLIEQEKMLLQLKDMIRDREQSLAKKDAELQKVNAELSKVKLHAKSKIASLSSQLNQSKKTAADAAEPASVGSDSESVSTLASESSVSEQTSRARQTLLHKRLRDKDRLISDKEAELVQLRGQLDAKNCVVQELTENVNGLQLQLAESETLFRARDVQQTTELHSASQTQPMDEILSQFAYKDSRIIELDSEIQQLHQTIIDLRENISEKDEAIRARDQAVQILRETHAVTESSIGQTAECMDEQHPAAVTQADSAAVSLVQTQLQETNELLAERENSMKPLTDELNSRNQYIAELSSHLANFESTYASLQASCAELEQERNAAVVNRAELETRIVDLETTYNDLLSKQTSLEQDKAALEQYYTAAQVSHAELNQRYMALEESHSTLQEKHTTLESSFMQLQVTHLELEQAYTALVQSHSEPQRDVNGEEAGSADRESLSYQLVDQQQQCEQLRASLADCESRFSKFKSLAGSQMKALEKELAALHESSDVVVMLKNQIAELEEEKGNLQLQLLDTDESKTAATVERLKQLEQQLVVEQQQQCELAEKNEVLERKLVEYEQTVAHFGEEIKTKDHILAEVRMSVEEREKQLETQRAEFEARELAGLQTSADLEAANQTIRTLEVEIGNRDAMIQNMHLDIEYKEQKLSQVAASSSQSHQLISDMECKLLAQDEEMKQLKHSVETSHHELQQLQAEMEKFHEADVTVDVYQQLQQQNAALQSLVTELRGELANLTTSLDESQTECQQLRANLHVTSSSDTEQKAAVSSLEARLEEIDRQSQEEILQWKEKVSSISDNLSACVAELEQLKESQRITAVENESLQTALAGKDDKLRTLSLQLEAGEESLHQARMELEADTSTHQMAVGKLQMHVKEMEELVQGKDKLVTGMNAELEDVRKQLEDKTNQEAVHQQMFVDRETLLSNTIATLHQQLEESAASVESLGVKCKEQDAEVHTLMKKLDDRDAKIASLSENFREEELQLIAVTEELEACKAQAAKDKALSEEDWQQVVDSKDAQIARLTESAHNQETQMKKYVAVIKKLKQQLQEEKLKREGLEKQSVSSLDDSGASAEQFLATDDKQVAVSAESDKPADSDVLIQQPVKNTIVTSCETSHPQPSDNEGIKAAAAEEQIAKLKEMNEQLQQEISKLESKSSEYETAVAHLDEVIAGLKGENETLKADAEHMLAEMRTVSDVSCAQMQELSTELIHWKSIASGVDQMRKDVARLEAEKLDATAKAEAVISEMTKLKNDLDVRSDDAERLNNQLSVEIAEKEAVKHELDCCKEIQAKLQSECANISDDRTRLEHQLTATCDTLQQLSDDNAKLRTSCETLKEDLRLLRTEAEAAKVMHDRLQVEYEENAAMKHMQIEVDKLCQTSESDSCRSMEEYSVLETENLHLTEQCNSLIKRLEENQNRYEEFVNCAKEKEGHLAKDSERSLGKLKAVEEKNTILQQHLNEVEFNYAKNLDSFKKIQNDLEAEKARLEMEVGKLTDMVLKSEGTIQQLVAEVGAEREEFSLRESELEGSSEELQLEVARLAQKVETDVDELESLRSRNKEIEMQLTSLASDKVSAERERNEYSENNRKLAQENEVLKTEWEELRQEKEHLAREFQSNQDTAKRKYAALSDQYDMLSTDINNYQELVESLRSKISQLEQQLQKTFAEDASQVAVNRQLEIERERLEGERQVRSEELESLRVRESELLCEVKRLQLQIEDCSNTEEELTASQSHVLAVQVKNDSLRVNVGELEQRVQELSVVEEEQSALQERYLSLLQDNSALIRQSKEMYEKLRSFNELAENSADQSATEVAALKTEVEMLRSEHENMSRKDNECEQLRAELLSLKAVTQQQTSELEALRASAYQQRASDKSENLDRELSMKAGKYYPALEHYHTAERQPELTLNEEDAKVHVVHVHSSHAHKTMSDDRPHEVSRLKAQLAELRTERSSLAERLHNAEKTSEQQQQELQRQLRSAEQNVQLRERDLMHVHQQYQLLYQQCVLLQQQSPSWTQPSVPQPAADGAAVQAAVVNTAEKQGTSNTSQQHVAELELRCRSLNTELSELRQSLAAEHQHRSHAEDMLRQAHEQLQIQQQLTAHTSEQRVASITEVTTEDDIPLMTTLTNYRDFRQLYKHVTCWLQNSSIMLGRTLRGHPRLRKSFLAYVLLLHLYVIFSCVLGWV